MAEENSLQQAASEALDVILEDSTLVRNINSSVKTKIKESMAQVVTSVTNNIPASGVVVESSVVANIENVQEAAQSELKDTLDQQVTISLGGFGLNFDPIITKITLELIDDLHLSAEVSDDQPETLQYRWNSSPILDLTDPFSTKAVLPNFDNSEIIIILRVTDAGESYVTDICTWDNSSNPTICDFIGN